MVESSGTAIPSTPFASPAAYARAPLMGSRGHCRPPFESGASARSTEASTSLAPMGLPSWNVAPDLR
jgi:hypothetical protein